MSLNQTFSALSEPNRRHILDMLKKREMSVSEMLAQMQITMPTLSHHLDILKRADLIDGRREGQQIFYSLNLSVLEDLSEKIIKFLKK